MSGNKRTILRDVDDTPLTRTDQLATGMLDDNPALEALMLTEGADIDDKAVQEVTDRIFQGALPGLRSLGDIYPGDRVAALRSEVETGVRDLFTRMFGYLQGDEAQGYLRAGRIEARNQRAGALLADLSSQERVIKLYFTRALVNICGRLNVTEDAEGMVDAIYQYMRSLASQGDEISSQEALSRMLGHLANDFLDQEAVKTQTVSGSQVRILGSSHRVPFDDAALIERKGGPFAVQAFGKRLLQTLLQDPKPNGYFHTRQAMLAEVLAE
jgi:hypothetical protein